MRHCMANTSEKKIGGKFGREPAMQARSMQQQARSSIRQTERSKHAPNQSPKDATASCAARQSSPHLVARMMQNSRPDGRARTNNINNTSQSVCIRCADGLIRARARIRIHANIPVCGHPVVGKEKSQRLTAAVSSCACMHALWAWCMNGHTVRVPHGEWLICLRLRPNCPQASHPWIAPLVCVLLRSDDVKHHHLRFGPKDYSRVHKCTGSQCFTAR